MTSFSFALGSSGALRDAVNVQSFNLSKLLIFCSCARRVGVIPSPGPWTHGKLGSSWSPSASCHHEAWQRRPESQDKGQEPVELNRMPSWEGNNECGVFHTIRRVLKAHPSITSRKSGRQQTKVWVGSQPLLAIWILFSPVRPWRPPHTKGPSEGTCLPSLSLVNNSTDQML